MDMPKLQVTNWLTLFFITLASSFAATGYGIVIGTWASTQTQASIFGSVSTVILAAIGGVWIPVTVMPDVLRSVSEISPMNWSIQGYYSVFLRSVTLIELLPQITKLMIFYACCTLLSLFFRKYQANKWWSYIIGSLNAFAKMIYSRIVSILSVLSLSNPRASDCGFRIVDFGLRISDCGFRIADCGLWI